MTDASVAMIPARESSSSDSSAKYSMTPFCRNSFGRPSVSSGMFVPKKVLVSNTAMLSFAAERQPKMNRETTAFAVLPLTRNVLDLPFRGPRKAYACLKVGRLIRNDQMRSLEI